MYANIHAPMSGQTLVPSQLYSSYATSTVQPDNSGAIESLADNFGNINVHDNQYPGQEGTVSNYLQANGHNASNMLPPKSSGQFMYQMSDGSFAYASPNPTQPHFGHFPRQVSWPLTHKSQYQAGSMPNYPSTTASYGPNTPRGQQWISPQNLPPVPELIEPRRTSWSSHDETSPHTPTFGPGLSYPYLPKHSPTAYSTPSPMSASNPYYPHIWKNHDGSLVLLDFWELVNREPAIPEPVPALRSGPDGGRGTLDKILDNRDGQTNVYVRGLQPDTSDEMLKGYGEKFGPVVSCKSIIDAITNHCKGSAYRRGSTVHLY